MNERKIKSLNEDNIVSILHYIFGRNFWFGFEYFNLSFICVVHPERLYHPCLEHKGSRLGPGGSLICLSGNAPELKVTTWVSWLTSFAVCVCVCVCVCIWIWQVRGVRQRDSRGVPALLPDALHQRLRDVRTMQAAAYQQLPLRRVWMQSRWAAPSLRSNGGCCDCFTAMRESARIPSWRSLQNLTWI